MNCRICEERTDFSFKEKVLNKYDVSYYYCAGCGALQTEPPYWLDEAYDDAIIDADTGLIRRNLYFSEMLSCILFKLFGTKGSYADVAGGYGMMTRLMRDRGFDYRWSDPYCENILARGFEAEFSEGKKYDAVSAFEVLEHTVNPIQFLEDTFEKTNADLIVFSTELFRAPAPKDWFYFAFEGGQHVVFFQKRTLSAMASRMNLRFYSNGTFHIFSKKRVSGLFLRLIRTPFRRLYLLWARLFLKSKTMSDHYLILNKNR